jgi:hypothetical protein
MTELERLEDIAGQWNNELEEDQSEDNNSNNGAYDIPDPNEISGIPEREPLAVNDDVPSNMDEEMLDKHFSGSEEEGTNISVRKSEVQLKGP